MSAPEIPPPVAQVFGQWPPAVQNWAKAVRALIFEVAALAEVSPLSETSKWGQPSYATEKTGAGTPVRLGYEAGKDAPCRLYVHCATSVIDQCRAELGNALMFQGDRAICMEPGADLSAPPLRRAVAIALTYHRDKAAQHG